MSGARAGRRYIGLVAALVCVLVPHAARTQQPGASADRLPACTWFAWQDAHPDRAYLRHYPAGSARDTMIMMQLRSFSNAQRIFPIYQIETVIVDGQEMKWVSRYGAFAIIEWSSGFAVADSGVITIDVNTPERLSGRFDLTAIKIVPDSAADPKLRMSGSFDATRDPDSRRWHLPRRNGEPPSHDPCLAVPPS